MDKEGTKEKFGDYLIDISKYVITAVLITASFNDISSSRVLMYVIGVSVAVLTFCGVCFILEKRSDMGPSVAILSFMAIVSIIGITVEYIKMKKEEKNNN